MSYLAIGSWFYRFRLFMLLVLQIPAFHVPGFLVPFLVPFPIPFPDSPFLVLQIGRKLRLNAIDGYNTCYNRFQSLHRKLRADPALLNEYDKIIRQQLEGGIIEQVRSTKEPAESGNRVNYLPHHPMIQGDKDTTKVCAVYDGSAKNSKEEKSLNDCLEISPNSTPHVFDTLVNSMEFNWCYR